MSSRLYKTLRVKLHLVYSLSSVLAIYEDTGYFAVWTNYNSMKSGLILEAILEEFDRLKKEIVTEEELSHAKIRYKRDLLHNFETNFSFAGFLGISELLTGEIETFEDILSKIGLVKDKDLFDLANKYFLDEDLLTVLLGKDKLSEDTKK